MSHDRAPLRAAWFVLWTILVVAALWAGLALRDWTFEATRPIRFRGDVDNAVSIGRRVVVNAARIAAATTQPSTQPVNIASLTPPTWPQLLTSYFETYDAEFSRAAARGQWDDAAFRLDYPPGRLLIVSAWCKRVAEEKGLSFRYSDDIVTPMRWVNTAHEFLAAAGAAALVWQALRRSGATALTAESLALCSGALLWLNPALILDAHGWPQWDAWVLPYTLWASFFALRDRWLAAGVLLALGSLFKGQVLLMAPMFALWPLFQLRLGAIARLAVGMAAMFAVAGAPWLVWRAEPFARWWVSIAIVLACILAAWPRRRVPRAEWVALCAVFFAWLSLACLGVGPLALPVAVIATASLGGLAALPRTRRLPLCLAAIAVVIFAGSLAFDGSYSWLRVGFQTDRYPELHRGNTVNLGSILERFYGYGSDAPITIGEWTPPLRMLLRWIAYAFVAIASLGIALRDRARDANVLIGFVATWTLLYAFMPQMHERYLVWAAAMSSLLVARSIGGMFVYLALSALQVSMLLCSMIESSGMTNDETFGQIHFVVRGMSPAAGWSTMTIAGVLLVWSFKRSPRHMRAGPSPVRMRGGDAPALSDRAGILPEQL